MQTVREIQRLNKQEAEQGVALDESWHHQYRDTAWIYVGGLPYEMTEGDVLCMFSQFGEIEKLDMRRDQVTGKFKGFCFIKYEDQRSTILAVDNFTGVAFAGRTIRVDHKRYNPPTVKKKKRNREELDSSEEEEELQREIEEKKALQDVRWENENYRKNAMLEPAKKKQKLSKEEKQLKKERKLERKRIREEKRKRKEEKQRRREKRTIEK